MEGVVHGRYYCNQNRTTELSNRMADRNKPNQHMQMFFGNRPVQTRQVHMPMLDCRKPSNVGVDLLPVYNNLTHFAGGSSLPFNGYQENVDVESKLKNIIFPLQKAAQSKYIPDSTSDMYCNYYLTANNGDMPMPHKLINKKEKFNHFNPNTLNVGNNLFYNNTRVQTRSTEE